MWHHSDAEQHGGGQANRSHGYCIVDETAG
jgi:hypothetical protein